MEPSGSITASGQDADFLGQGGRPGASGVAGALD